MILEAAPTWLKTLGIVVGRGSLRGSQVSGCQAKEYWPSVHGTTSLATVPCTENTLLRELLSSFLCFVSALFYHYSRTVVFNPASSIADQARTLLGFTFGDGSLKL